MRKYEIGKRLLEALFGDERARGLGMGPGSKRELLGPIGRLFGAGTVTGLSDAQLLDRFILRHDEAAEAAFAALVERHGPMVLAVCRRILNDPHDAQDAFQATFLVLMRKASTVRKRQSIADWLYGVARRVSAHSWADLARRRAVERRAGTMSSATHAATQPDREVWEEVEQLPRDLRAAIVLCYLEGLTHEQAARRLGWPVGTVRSRLARARDRLRARLTKKGLAPDTAILPVCLLKAGSVSEVLIEPTVKAAMLLAPRDAAGAGLVSASAATLTEGVLRTMLVSKWKLTAASLLAAGTLACGAGLYAYQDPKSGAKPASPVPPATDGSRMVSALDVDAFAAKMQLLVLRVREEQARGNIERAVLSLGEIETLAGKWKNALTDAKLREPDNRPRPRTPPADELPPVALALDPGSAESRLDRLERTVERLVRSLEKDSRAAATARDPLGGDLQPLPPRLEGVVQKVDGANKRVEISIGSDDGLAEGHELTVFRLDRLAQSGWQFEFLGRIRILATDPDQSVGRVIYSKQGKQIRPGDKVSPRLPGIEGGRTSSAPTQKR
jgi:RNA polymerase sigma factor (sigma-70 family)